jgi:hypothetical protein
MTARQVALVVALVALVPAIRASLVQVTADTDAAALVRAIDNNAAQILALLAGDE